MTSLLLFNTKEILKNVGNQAVLVTMDFHSFKTISFIFKKEKVMQVWNHSIQGQYFGGNLPICIYAGGCNLNVI